jgi:hypothetical protein
MTGFGVCQACAASLDAGLIDGHASQGSPIGCCVQCKSFACRFHGERESHTQVFRCVECLPAFVLFGAVAHSGSTNELARIINGRQPAWINPGSWHIDSPQSFIEEHDLVRAETAETFKVFYRQCQFDLDRPELQRSGWEKIVRDLKRIQFRLDSTPQRDLLRMSSAYLAFIYSHAVEDAVLPLDMQVLRNAILPLPEDNYRVGTNNVLVM